MRANHDAITARGAQIVAIGQGQGDYAARFCEQLETGFPCLGDPERRGYRALGLLRSSWWGVTAQPFLQDPVAGFRRIRDADLRAAMLKESDVLQLGGVVIVDREGTVRYLHRSQDPSDLPPTQELLDVLDSL
jgi:peroxiredoxin